METQRHLARTSGGRDIEYLTAGPEDGLPLVVHEGTPVGLSLNTRLANAAAERGLRAVLAARPGYEASTPRPGRTVADVVPDTAAVLDAIGAGEYLSIGFSGGGPHTLACAALAPGRCLAAASVAGVAPYTAAGLDFLAGMGPENIEEFSLAVRGADALTPFLDKEAAALREITGEQIVAALGGLISGADAEVLTGEFAADLAAGLRGAGPPRHRGLARRRPRVHRRLGIPHRGGRGPRGHLAGRPGQHGPVRARPVARRSHSRCPRPPGTGGRPPHHDRHRHRPDP